MLLLFVLTIGRHADARASVVARIEQAIARLEADLAREQAASEALSASVRQVGAQVEQASARQVERKRDLTRMESELALLLSEQAARVDERERLLASREDIPKEETRPPVPIPNIDRRQYLTGFNFDGRAMLFIIETSGGMLGYTVDEAIDYTARTEAEKRRSPKWRQVVKSVQWILANLRADQRYQILLFGAETRLLVPGSEGEWLDATDRGRTSEVLERLEAVLPGGGANLERAFATARRDFPLAESIVLMTDSLPTLSDSLTFSGATSDADRERMFRSALRELPRKTPVNTILYPMSGDPAAAFLYWQLADSTQGSLISPARGWPDT